MFARPAAGRSAGIPTGAGKKPGFFACSWLTVRMPVVGAESGGAIVMTWVARLFGRFALAQATNSGVSTVYWLALVLLERSTSTAPKRKSLFLSTGPPKVAPTSLR